MGVCVGTSSSMLFFCASGHSSPLTDTGLIDAVGEHNHVSPHRDPSCSSSLTTQGFLQCHELRILYWWHAAFKGVSVLIWNKWLVFSLAFFVMVSPPLLFDELPQGGADGLTLIHRCSTLSSGKTTSGSEMSQVDQSLLRHIQRRRVHFLCKHTTTAL